MKSEKGSFSNLRRRAYRAGVLALTAALPASIGIAQSDTYTWSAELVGVDRGTRTVTVQSRLVGNAEVDFDSLDSGDRVTLTWSGINTAAGVRRIVDGAAPAEDQLTLPIEFVSAENDKQYVRFKVLVPSDDLSAIASLSPGSWITATSPRRAQRFEEAVADARPYNDVG